MEPRYWLRHPSLAGLIGPLPRREAVAAIANGSLPSSCEVLEDAGQGRDAAAASGAWTMVGIALGVGDRDGPPPPAPNSGPALPPADRSPAAARLLELRRGSAYATFRTLVDLSAGVLTVFAAVRCIQMLAIVSEFGDAGAVLGAVTAELLVIWIGRYVCQLLADLADAALRR